MSAKGGDVLKLILLKIVDDANFCFQIHRASDFNDLHQRLLELAFHTASSRSAMARFSRPSFYVLSIQREISDRRSTERFQIHDAAFGFARGFCGDCLIVSAFFLSRVLVMSVTSLGFGGSYGWLTPGPALAFHRGMVFTRAD